MKNIHILKVNDKNKKPFLTIISFIVGGSTTSGDGNYWILSTDYDSYSLVWSCTDLGLFNTRKYYYYNVFSGFITR